MENSVVLFSLTNIFDGTFFFLTFIVSVYGFVGLMSKSFIMAAYSAFIAFITITIETGYPFYENLMIVIVALLLMLLSFQIYNMAKGEGAGASGSVS